jgi:hypothetical protein
MATERGGVILQRTARQPPFWSCEFCNNLPLILAATRWTPRDQADAEWKTHLAPIRAPADRRPLPAPGGTAPSQPVLLRLPSRCSVAPFPAGVQPPPLPRLSLPSRCPAIPSSGRRPLAGPPPSQRRLYIHWSGKTACTIVLAIRHSSAV